MTRLPAIRLRLSLSLLIPALVGCGAVDRDRLRAALDRHDLDEAGRIADDALATREGDAQRASGQHGRTLLERAVIRAAQSDFTGAAADLAAGDRGLGLDDLLRNAKTRRLHEPEAFRYEFLRGWAQALNVPPGLKFYEWLLLNPLGALFRLETDDAAGACVEGRRFGAVADWTESIAPGRAKDVRAFGEVVSALACDAAGDQGFACAARVRAGDRASLVPGLDSRCNASYANGPRDLVVVVAYGRVSHPVYRTSEDPSERVSVVHGGETASDGALRITVDGAEIAHAEALDVESALQADYAESLTAIEVTVLGAKGRTGQWSPWAWELLPAHIEAAHASAAPGRHEIVVHVRGREMRRAIELRAGDPRAVTLVVPW